MWWILSDSGRWEVWVSAVWGCVAAGGSASSASHFFGLPCQGKHSKTNIATYLYLLGSFSLIWSWSKAEQNIHSTSSTHSPVYLHFISQRGVGYCLRNFYASNHFIRILFGENWEKVSFGAEKRCSEKNWLWVPWRWEFYCSVSCRPFMTRELKSSWVQSNRYPQLFTFLLNRLPFQFYS